MYGKYLAVERQLYANEVKINELKGHVEEYREHGSKFFYYYLSFFFNKTFMLIYFDINLTMITVFRFRLETLPVRTTPITLQSNIF